jgi:hypothetical protein
MVSLTDKEISERLAALKAELSEAKKFEPESMPDALLLRFLKARRFDVSKALKMFLDYLAWRIEANVDETVKSYVFPEAKAVAALYPRFYHKTDRRGRPIYIEQLGFLNVNKLFGISTPERIIQAYVREYEKVLAYRFPACSTKAGHHIEQGCTILDLKGVPLTQFNQVRKIVQQVSSIAQNYYPETLGRMFIINAPLLFKGVWAMVKPMLDENTVAKISVLSSHYEKELLEDIDPQSLPAFYGGKCDCPGGCESSDVGPWNDGSVPGYPIAFWEDIKKRDV